MGFVRADPLTVPLSGSLDQQTSELFRGPGALEDATNGSHDKGGELRKRRGYRLMETTVDTHGLTPEILFVSVGVLDGELVVYGRDFVYGTHADTAIVDLASLTQRGPTMLGDVDVFDVLAIGMTE